MIQNSRNHFNMEANLFLHLISFILLIFALGNVKASSTTDSFIDKPDEEVYSDEGSDVTLEWHFHVGSWSSSSTFREFLFGVWDDPGFVKNKILAVQKRNVVHKRSGFERKVDWSGNIYDCVNCTAIVKMYNLTDVDFKKYGVEMEIGLDRSHLTNWLRLVKFVPAEIIRYPRRIEVEEGHATAIECKATGNPTPSVIIKKKNRTLCNDSTGRCVYEIRKAKPEDEGEYLCLVQQRNYSQIRRFLNLKVLKGRNISAIDTNAENRTTIKTTQNDAPMAVLGQTTDSDITGFIKEQLDLVCMKPRIDENMNVARYLSQDLEEPDKPERFVTSKWNETIRNYTKLCNTEHKLHNICSQMTSYVTANAIHFVIESAPLELNKYKTQCAYEYEGHTLKPNNRGSVQIIELQDKIEGYVADGRIEKECSFPSRCRSVTLNINDTEAKISHTNMTFPCLHDRYYEICRDHMNLSYVNGTCRVIFVFDKTPASLNNARLRCHIRYQNVNTDNYYDPIDTIIFLRYKRNDSTVTTASPLPGTTSTTASSTNTSTNGTTTSTEKDGLSKKVIAIIVSVGLVVAALAVAFIFRHRIRSWFRNVLTRVRNRCCGNQNDHEVVSLEMS